MLKYLTHKKTHTKHTNVCVRVAKQKTNLRVFFYFTNLAKADIIMHDNPKIMPHREMANGKESMPPPTMVLTCVFTKVTCFFFSKKLRLS